MSGTWTCIGSLGPGRLGKSGAVGKHKAGPLTRSTLPAQFPDLACHFAVMVWRLVRFFVRSCISLALSCQPQRTPRLDALLREVGKRRGTSPRAGGDVHRGGASRGL